MPLHISIRDQKISSKKTGYLSHVDGLRAIAVVAVVLYHLDTPGFLGGFVGVDIFFVISGFLITSLIKAEVLANGTFRFGDFYLRRARRILPALLVTLACTFLAAYFVLSPEHLEQAGGSLVAAVLSVSNIFFWTISGYFDTGAALKPLLHTWSLSVEEQFYLFWPLFLALALRFGNRPTLALLATVGVASFGLNLWIEFFAGDEIANKSSTMFFLTPFRVFEFAIGAALAWLPAQDPEQKVRAEVLTIAGLVLLMVGIVGFRESTPFPTYNALIPCFGAALVIVGAQHSFVGRLLRNQLAVGLGLISYSLYLVHWPLITLWGFHRELSNLDKIAIIAVSVLAATSMYHFIEQPFRTRRLAIVARPRNFVAGAFALSFLVAIPGFHAWANSGWTWRYGSEVAALIDAQNFAAGPSVPPWHCFLSPDETPSAFDQRCYGTDSDVLRVMLVGDSTAWALAPGLIASLPTGSSLGILTSSNCPPLLGYASVDRPNCEEANSEFFNNTILANDYDVVIMASLAQGALVASYFAETKAALEIAGVDFVLIGPGVRFKRRLRDLIVEYGSLPALEENLLANLETGCIDEDGYDELVTTDQFFSLKKVFCNDGRVSYREGQHLYFVDEVHLSRMGSLKAAQSLVSWMDDTGMTDHQ